MAGKEDARYPLEELASLPSFHHPTPSPDGDRIAFYHDGSGRNELYVLDVETGERRQVSDGEVPRDASYPVAWSRDGERVFFHRDEAGDEQNDVHAIDVGTGETEPVVELDGQCILTDVGERGLLVVSDAGDQLNLYRHDVGGETVQLTAYENPVLGAQWSPDGDRIAYVGNESDDLDNSDVYVIDADREEPVTAGNPDARRIDAGADGFETTVHDWHGERLLVSDNSRDRTRIGVYDLAADDATWLSPGDHEESADSFLPDGRVIATRTRRAADVPVVYDPDGDGDDGGRELDLPEGVASPAGGYEPPVLADGDLLVTQSTTDRRTELLRYDPDADATETVIAAEYGDIDPGQFVAGSYHRFESHDGLEIGAVVYDARDAGFAAPTPAVVKVHGGPRHRDAMDFDLYAQFLVSRGYTVLEVNYRGSTGRGREFEDMLKMDWGGDEQADVAAGTRWLAAKEWVDADRIAVFGGSYGGYSANCQMTQYPGLYAAGVSWVGVSDLHTFHEEAMAHYRTALIEKYMGDPEANRELWRERSPVEHVENVAAPFLIVHGVNDPRVPIGQARQLRAALLDAGFVEYDPETGERTRPEDADDERDVEFEYEELGEEGHGSTDIAQKIRAFRLMDDFLSRRMPATAAAEADD